MMKKIKKYHYIYKITCNVTKRYYIGMHSTNDLNDGYFGSGKRLWFSIKYHGKENHTKEILEYCDNREELNKREKEIITDKLINENLCMNLVRGGQGGGGCINFSEEKLLKFTKSGVIARINKLNNDSNYKAAVMKTASENLKKAWSEGKFQNNKRFKGLMHNENSKKLISDKAKERVGEKNSQYGTCWITKDGVNKKIKKENIAIYLTEGWIKGRIL